MIGTQRFDYPTKLIRIPLRVLVVPGNPTDTASLEPFASKALKVYSSTGLNDVSVYGESNELKPTNPFAARNQDNSILDIAMEILQTVSCRRNSSIIRTQNISSVTFFLLVRFVSDSYNITNSQGKVARFCLFKQAFRIGDDVVGICDFSEANVSCVQV